MKRCSQCPRRCGLSKKRLSEEEKGISTEHSPYCGKPEDAALFPFARSMRHFWEEPCISGSCGSGVIFFGGCNLGCAFCQNYEISHSNGKTIQASDLENEIFRLRDLGCHNINLVTGSHLVAELAPVLRQVIQKGLQIPIVWNTGAYETAEQLRSLDGVISIYLPDLKFFSSDLSAKVADAPDYFSIATKAILEMVRQKPVNKYHAVNTNITNRCHDNMINACKPLSEEIMEEGVLIRHLVLPGFYKDSIQILEWIEANLSSCVSLSLMSQYLPDYYVKNHTEMEKGALPSLRRKVTTYEYEKVVEKAVSLGFQDVYTQKREAASNEFVPEFPGFSGE